MNKKSYAKLVFGIILIAALIAAGMPSGVLARPLAATVTFTGNAAADFAGVPGMVSFGDSSTDVGVPSSAPGGTISGWNFTRLYFVYDAASDTMYVGVDCIMICSDADGDGNPGGTSGWLNTEGGEDQPDLANSESFTLLLDGNNDYVNFSNAIGRFETAVGVSSSKGLSGNIFTDWGVYDFMSGSPGLPSLGYGALIAGHASSAASPSASAPDLEFTIGNFSTLPGFTFTPGEVFTFKASLFAGSLEDDGIGEDYLPAQTSSISVTIGDVDWTVVKTNDVGGSAAAGTPFNWSVAVSNNAGMNTATFASGDVIFRDNLPSGPTYGAVTVTPSGLSGTGTVACSIASNILTCTASGGTVKFPASASFTAAFSVTAASTGSLVNPTGGVCRVDPNNLFAETDETNNNCSDTVTILGQPNLTAVKTNNTGGTGVVGVPYNWTIQVSNAPGTSTASFGPGQLIFRDVLPAGPTYGIGGVTMSGGTANVTCGIISPVVECYPSGTATIPAGGSFSFNVSVTPASSGSLVNPTGGVCQADPSGLVLESNEGDNACSNTVNVLPQPNLTAVKTNDVGGSLVLGGSFNWSILVSNAASTSTATFTNGQVIFRDNLPSGPTYGAVTVTPSGTTGTISCSIAANVLTCTAGAGGVTIPSGASFTAGFPVTPNAAPVALVNPTGGTPPICRVDPDTLIAEGNEGDNECFDTVNVLPRPDLTATKTNDVGGTVALGGSYTWTVQVNNAGGTSTASYTNGQTILTDNLPSSGATYGAVTVTPSGTTGTINCSIAANNLTCTANGGVTIPAGASFTVAFPVTPTAAGSLANPRGGGICRVDPNNNVTEGNEGNNNCADTVTVVAPDLTATKTNNVGGSLVLGGSYTWTVAINNGGTSTATIPNGFLIIQDDVPAGQTYGAINVATAGGTAGPITCIWFDADTWYCVANGSDVTIPAGGSITLSFLVTPVASGSLVNPSGGICRVDANGQVTESNEGNNDCSNTVNVLPPPDLTAVKTNNVSGSLYLGGSYNWTIQVSNAPGTSTASFGPGQLIFRDVLPAGPTYGIGGVTMSGGTTNVTCGIISPVVECYPSGTATIPAGGSFSFNVSVTPASSGSLVNPTGGVCQVDPNTLIAEGNEGNNTCSDTVTVLAQPDLTAVKTNDAGGSLVLGGSFNWSILASNTANTVTFTNGQVILRDNLPSGPAYGAVTVTPSGLGGAGTVSCGIAANVLTCTASGGSVIFNAGNSFTAAFSVIPAAAGSLVNPTGGVCRVDPNGLYPEASEANNDCSDTVTVQPRPELTAVKTNDVGGSLVLGGSYTWSIVLSNAAGTSTATYPTGMGILILQDDLPAGPAYGPITVTTAGGTAGPVNCWYIGNIVACDASGAPVTIPAGGSITLSFSVTPAASGSLTNPSGICRIDPNGYIAEGNEGNNNCSNTVTVLAQPDLAAVKTNNVGGSMTVGGSYTWSVLVSNAAGTATATYTAGQTILTDNLPAGPAYGAVTVTPAGGTAGPISCAVAGDVLTCTASGGSVTIPANGSFTAAFSVTPAGTGSLVNPTGGICRVDPDTLIVEGNEGNNDCGPDTVTVLAQPDLTAVKTNDVGGSLALGGFYNWSIVVSNSTNTATFMVGETILRDNLPVGPTYGAVTVTPAGGTAGTINCVIGGATLNCSAGAGGVTIPAGASFTAQFLVTPTAAGSLVNPTAGICRVDPNNNETESVESNNDCSDTVTVVAPELTAVKTNDAGGSIDLGDTFNWSILVTNSGTSTATFASGQTVLVDNLPAGPTYAAPSVTPAGGTAGPIDCGYAGLVLQCTANGAPVTIPVGGTITISFTVAPDVSGSLVNPTGGACRVDSGSVVAESNEGNNDCSDTVTVTGAELGDWVWADTNSDGLQNDGATGIDGVTVDLFTGLGAHVATDTTTGGGYYLFPDLAPGNYYLEFTLPTGFAAFTTANVGANDSIDSDTEIVVSPTVMRTATTALTAGEVDHTWDAGLIGDAPLIGISKRVVTSTLVSPGTWDVTYEIYVRNYGNVPLTALQVTDDLVATFPLTTTFAVQSVVSADFAENWPGYNGSSNISLLAGTDALNVGASGTITVVVRVVPAAVGPFLNTAIAVGTPPSGPNVSDSSQDGTNPDNTPSGNPIYNNNGDPTDNNEPTPVTFGPTLFDPPFGIKMVDANGLPVLRWTMVWINNTNIVAVDASVSDGIPVGTTYVPGSVSCAGEGVTTTSTCLYEAPSPAYPRGRIVWTGVIGPDLGATDAISAVNELYIRFNVTVDAGVTSVQNEATIDSDRNGDGDTTDGGEQLVARANAVWQQIVGGLPATGFAPGRVTDLSGLERTGYDAVGDVRLEIPSLGVNVPIVGVPFTNGNWDVNWLLNQAGWLEGTAFPSLAGNSVLTSHVYLPSGLPGPFVNLSRLRWGDRIIVHAFGNRYVYEVRSNRLVAPSDTGVLRHEDLAWLTLITCRQYDESIGGYRYRVVVRAALLEVTAEP